MMVKHGTKIEWTHVPGFKGETLNPTAGCSVVSPGCHNCYAERLSGGLLASAPIYAGVTKPGRGRPRWTGKINYNEAALVRPLRQRKPRAYFVNSMSDLFHESIPNVYIDRVFEIAARCPHHIFMILTKRAERMRAWAVSRFDLGWTREPLRNVWLGVSVEDQIRANERIPLLLETPAAVRFLSVEPLLGPVNVLGPCRYAISVPAGRELGRIDWVIVGGESGPDARPMHPAWARGIRDQCMVMGIPFFFKQWGEYAPDERISGWVDKDENVPAFEGEVKMHRVGKKRVGCRLDGKIHHAWPLIEPEIKRAALD